MEKYVFGIFCFNFAKHSLIFVVETMKLLNLTYERSKIIVNNENKVSFFYKFNGQLRVIKSQLAVKTVLLKRLVCYWKGGGLLLENYVHL